MPPRRRYVATIKVEADAARDLIGQVYHIADNWDRNGISPSSVSGGYNSGHIVTVDCDESITHESWWEAMQAREKA